MINIFTRKCYHFCPAPCGTATTLLNDDGTAYQSLNPSNVGAPLPLQAIGKALPSL
jgi:hypothetical protein